MSRPRISLRAHSLGGSTWPVIRCSRNNKMQTLWPEYNTQCTLDMCRRLILFSLIQFLLFFITNNKLVLLQEPESTSNRNLHFPVLQFPVPYFPVLHFLVLHFGPSNLTSLVPHFPVLHFLRPHRKSATKFLCVKTVSDVVRHLLAYLSVRK